MLTWFRNDLLSFSHYSLCLHVFGFVERMLIQYNISLLVLGTIQAGFIHHTISPHVLGTV